jgi:heme exporter protein CcmD
LQALTMGGYGGYVWAAFGFALISMIGLLLQSWRAQQRRADELAALRSTVRGGTRRRAEQHDPAPPRRLIATKPGQVQPEATAARATRSADGSEPATQRFAVSRPSSGT